jgi:hypothetical protein
MARWHLIHCERLKKTLEGNFSGTNTHHRATIQKIESAPGNTLAVFAAKLLQG